MKRVIIECGCGVVVESRDYDNDSQEFDMQILAGECEICVRNNGRYDRSPHWTETQHVPQATLEDVRNKFNGKKK